MRKLLAILSALLLLPTLGWAQRVVPSQGVLVKTTSYAVGPLDAGKLIVMNCSTAPCVLTLPKPRQSPIWMIWVSSTGSVPAQISPNGSLLDGSSNNLTVSTPTGLQIETDNANYYTVRGGISKNSSGDYVQYVSPSGNDSNDGLSWGSAKQTVYHALLALPGGSASRLTAGSGTIWLTGTVNYGGPLLCSGKPCGGFWIMGSADPNYSSPPTGWLKQSGPITLRGFGQNLLPGTGERNVAQIMAGPNNYTDRTKPQFWWSNIAGITVKDVGWAGSQAGNYGRISVCSNGNRNGTCGSAQFLIDNNYGYYSGGVPLGAGPAVDIGSTTFWGHIEHSTFGGNPNELYQIMARAGLSRSSNVVTATTTTKNDLAVGQSITVFGASDPTFNGVYAVTGVSGSPQTTVTWSQTGPNAVAGGGYLWSDRAYGIAINPGTGPGAGTIFFRDNHVLVGGIRHTGVNNDGIDVDGVELEAPFAPSAAGVEIINPQAGNFKVLHIDMNDVTNSVPGLLVQNGYGTTSVQAMATDGSLGAIAGIQGATRKYGGVGFAGSYMIGDTNIPRRMFPPTTVRYMNLANTNPTTWTFYSGSGMVKSGIKAPDGTTGAGQAKSNSGVAQVNFYTANIGTPTVNDWWIVGGWVRPATSAGFRNNCVLQMFMTGTGNLIYPPYGSTVVGAGNVGGSACVSTADPNDGDWVWVYSLAKIWAGVTAATLGFVANTYAGHPIQVYAPILIHIPASDGLSDSEVYELVASLGATPTNAAQGDIAMMPGQRFGISGSTQFLHYLTHSSTANRSTVLADGDDSTVIATTLTTTSAASDTVALKGVTVSSHCWAYPQNAAAASNLSTTYISMPRNPNQVVVNHTTTAGMVYTIACTPN